jgi:hypothetical protein
VCMDCFKIVYTGAFCVREESRRKHILRVGRIFAGLVKISPLFGTLSIHLSKHVNALTVPHRT